MRCSRLGVPTSAAGSRLEQTLATQVAAECRMAESFRAADALELPRLFSGRGTRGRSCSRDPPGRVSSDAGSRCCRQEAEVLRQIALIGAHRVRGRVLVQPEVFEKGFDVLSNHACRSCEARRSRDRVCLRSCLARRTRGVERRHEAERDVRRLVVFRIGVRDVIGQRAERGRPRRRDGSLAEGQRGGVAAGDQAGRRRLDVAFDAGHLPGEKQVVAHPRLPRLAQDGRRVDVGVAMDHPEAHELGLLEPGNHRSTRACSPHFICVWKPTRLK